MKTITNSSKIPHGGAFQVKHPISGQDFSSPNLKAVYGAFQKYSRDNGYPVLANEEIEALICQQHPSICSEQNVPSNAALAHITAQLNHLSQAEISKLLPDLTDPTLIGNRIAALTAAMGIPSCGGCISRQNWLNRAHQWLRNNT